MSKKVKPGTIRDAGSNYRVQSSTEFLGEQSVGSKRNEGLKKPTGYLASNRNEEFTTVPEFSDDRDGGRTRIKVAANKPNASKPSGARPDSSPDNKFQRSTSGPRHPGKGAVGSSPRHPQSKPVSSSPSGGPRMPENKNSADVNDTVRGSGYGNYREPVKDAVERKRSDFVDENSTMLHPNNNGKKRAGSHDGVRLSG